ncbi:MAG: thioredoxin family protein [Bacteroidales bacterium]|nr:thioredoxin family protein [Bacteroidales bacterium]
MKHFCVALLMLFTLTTAAARTAVTWRHEIVPAGDNAFDITFKATIPEGWHMYDLGPYGHDGPYPTSIVCEVGEGGTVNGSVRPERPSDKTFEELFQMEIGSYKDSIAFTQRISCQALPVRVEANLEWMICNDVSCMPPRDTVITVSLGGMAEQAVPVAADNRQTARFAVETFPIPADLGGTTEVQPADGGTAPATTTQSSWWRLLLEAMLWGIAAILTPCVFPMVPMTISFFLRGEGSDTLKRMRALLYGLCIVLIYTVPIALVVGMGRLFDRQVFTADTLNWISTHWIPNVLFFIVFMVFAASFFGFFNLQLPARWVNRADQRTRTIGWTGIFFMALTLVLVSFSCTGPIVGTVLIKSLSGEFWIPVAAMAVYAITFALPFTLFALFPAWLSRWPHSGQWLETVKISIAFIELALGFKFLSVADQTYHWGILGRTTYLIIWIVLFLCLALYLLRILRFHGEKRKGLSWGRAGFALLTLAFVAYMIPGLWGAPLKMLSGYLPPQKTTGMVADYGLTDSIKYADKLSLPHGLTGFFDLQQAEAYATATGKPLFIDFTGHGCVNCREMEARVWSDERVLELLRDHYVPVALYVDDRTEAEASDWVTVSGKVLKTIGRINAHIAETRYGVSAEPAYLLQSPSGELLAPVYGYNLNPDLFVRFLQQGLERMRGGE